MHCQNCGRTNQPDALFCDTCGVRLTTLAPPSSPVVQPIDSAEDFFIGRQAEMDILQDGLSQTVAGRGSFIVLVGEPGIGKSRTAREFAIGAEQGDTQVHWGRCNEEPGAPPYWPWVQALRSYTRGHDTQTLRDEMGVGAADIAEIVPEVRDRLADLPPPQHLEGPAQVRFRLFDSMATFLKNASRQCPLVLILDDLHWADIPSLRLLAFLVPELRDSRTLIIGAYRDIEQSHSPHLSDTLGYLVREPQYQRVWLQGLPREDTGRFMARTIGATSTPTLVDAVHRQTEGNPLFLKEVVRLLAQDMPLARSDSDASISVPIPASVPSPPAPPPWRVDRSASRDAPGTLLVRPGLPLR